MNTIVSLYSQTNQEIANFLKSFNNINVDNNLLEWKKEFENPIEIADIIGVFIDNNEKYKINMWISLDKGFFLNVTEHNADQIIRYLLKGILINYSLLFFSSNSSFTSFASASFSGFISASSNFSSAFSNTVFSSVCLSPHLGQNCASFSISA